MNHLRAAALVVCFVGMIHTPAEAQPPTCVGGAPENPYTGTVPSGQVWTIPFTTPLPCETISFNVQITTSRPGGATFTFNVYNYYNGGYMPMFEFSGTVAYGQTFSRVTPTPWSESGTPYPNVRGASGWPSTFKVGSSIGDVAYTVTITRTPRPGYNTGGWSFASAPLIQMFEPQYGSLTPPEGGQYYKIHLNPWQDIRIVGQARAATSPGTNFSVNLYNAYQQWVTTLIYSTINGTEAFPTPGDTNQTFTNWTGSGVDMYL